VLNCCDCRYLRSTGTQCRQFASNSPTFVVPRKVRPSHTIIRPLCCLRPLDNQTTAFCFRSTVVGLDCRQRPTSSNKQTNERTNKRTNKQTNEQTNKRTNKQTNKQTNEQTNKRTNQPTNQPTTSTTQQQQQTTNNNKQQTTNNNKQQTTTNNKQNSSTNFDDSDRRPPTANQPTNQPSERATLRRGSWDCGIEIETCKMK